MRCAHWGCEISAKMCLARQHVGRRGWQGDRYSFKSVPKDLYCMSDKCGQGLKVRQYMEDGDMEQIKEYLTGGAEKPGPARQNETAREKLEARTGERMCGICRKWFKHTEENFRMSAATKRLVATCRGCEKRFPKLRWKNGKPYDGEDATATPNVATATPNVATPTPEVAPVPLPRPTVQQASSSSTRTATEDSPRAMDVAASGCKCRTCMKTLPWTAEHFRINEATGEPIKTCLSCEEKYGSRKKPAKPKPAVPDGMRRCSVCGAEKPYAEFNRNLSIKDGFDRFCRVCKSVRQKNYRETARQRKVMGIPKPHPNYALAPAPGASAEPKQPRAIQPGVVYETRSMSDITAVPVPPGRVVTVDFSCCPSVLETLEAISREEFRTPAQQILYFLAKNLDAKEAMSGVQSQKVG